MKILLKTKQAPKLEDEISDFFLFLIESERIRFADVEKKEFFLEENKMNKFLQDYSEECLLELSNKNRQSNIFINQQQNRSS